jgi:hypothetical protein
VLLAPFNSANLKRDHVLRLGPLNGACCLSSGPNLFEIAIAETKLRRVPTPSELATFVGHGTIAVGELTK